MDQELVDSSAVMGQELVDSSAVMKNEINNNPELSTRQAYDNVQQIAREDRGNIHSFKSAMSTIERERRRHIPEIPTTIAKSISMADGV